MKKLNLKSNKKNCRFLLVSVTVFIGLFLIGGVGFVNHTAQAAPAVKKDGKYLIRLAYGESTEDVYHKAMVTFKDLIELRSKGEVKVELYPYRQLGTPRDNLGQLRSGALEMCLAFYTYLSQYVPWVNILDYPFAMPTEQEYVWRLFDNKIVPATNRDLNKKGIHILMHLSTGGFKMWVSANSPIRRPEDIKGKKYRVGGTGIGTEMVTAWGGKPVAMPYLDTIPALRQGVIDMMDQPAPAALIYHFYDVAKYGTKADLSYGATTVCVAKDWFDSLPGDIQDLIKQNMRIVIDYANCDRARTGAGVFRALEEKGVKIHYLTAEEKEAFKATLGPVKEFAIKTYGMDKVQLFLEN